MILRINKNMRLRSSNNRDGISDNAFLTVQADN